MGWLVAGADRSRFLASPWTGQNRTELNRPGGSGALFSLSLTLPSLPVHHQCVPRSPPVYSRCNFGRIRTHTVRYVPMTVPTVSSLSQSRSKSQSKSQDDPGLQGPGCPHRLTPTLTYSGRACSFFDWPSGSFFFYPHIPPFPSHTPAHFFSTSTTTDLSDYSFSLLLPYPSPNLVFVTIGFSSSSPLSLFGHVLLSSLALAVVVSVSHNDAPSGPPPSDQPVSCISGSSDLTCPTAVSGFGPPVPR